MERIGSSSASSNSTSTSNLTPEPLVCETPSPEPVASCPDGSIAFDQGVCAKAGLKGPPTAAERYAASLFEAAPDSNPVAPGAPPEVANELQAAKTSGASAIAIEQTLRQLVHDAGDAVVDSVRRALATGSLEAGRKYEYHVKLPNGCEGKFSISAALEKDAGGKPELVAQVTGAVEGKIGLVSASAEFTYSKSTSGKESIAFGACVFGGVDQEAGGLFELEAKAGVCATIVDSRDAAATLELDAVLKVGAGIGTSEGFGSGYEFEARKPLTRESTAFEILH